MIRSGCVVFRGLHRANHLFIRLTGPWGSRWPGWLLLVFAFLPGDWLMAEDLEQGVAEALFFWRKKWAMSWISEGENDDIRIFMDVFLVYPTLEQTHTTKAVKKRWYSYCAFARACPWHSYWKRSNCCKLHWSKLEYPWWQALSANQSMMHMLSSGKKFFKHISICWNP